MRALVQRVSDAAVNVEGSRIAQIGSGLLVLLGITHSDDETVADRLADKVLALRVFADEQGRMNQSLEGREILCVSQFTLYADTQRGNRPSFTGAAEPGQAKRLYERFCARTGAKQGRFGAHMRIELEADGPVTLLLELDRPPSSAADR
jgi:D-aminoacyl-tRNA deacylase